ncbi:signal recognition particle protein [Phototrophicus methaneseepsis]|uniref:Signal recognition particle protein n=1 Tax=Phototrophicus methaneseepsis TaxID=2710758 RepID=A0A7S8E5Q6_9CHLR|nr:signal recognition particle protein [Phototrophicus methaneseepsis]QPC80856.1 signal recognition particle protein [Phototrophicus methaneseepsis]
MFESLSQRLQNTFDRLGGGRVVTEQDVKDAMRDVRMALLEADVALPIVKDFVGRVRDRAIGAEVHKTLRPHEQVVKIIHEEMRDTLGEAGRLNFSGSTKPHVIMMVGLQGSGKTTSAAKLAMYLRKEGRQPFLVAADTYRPAAVDQLVTLAKQVNIPYYEEGVSAKPTDIAKRGLEAAKNADASVVIIDTAGRLQIDDQLMTELEEIKRRTNPAEILLVADAMTGQEAVNIATGFNERVGITGLVLTKVDGDARGGAALSMRAVTGVPIKFMGTGEKISLETFEQFHPERIADRILGMGDMMTLIEKAESLYEEEEAMRLQQKMMENKFTLQDFLDQLRKIRRMGPIGKVLGMLPGMSKLQMQGMLDNEEVEARISKVEAILNSMTIQEREKPKILNASRKKRIARGSGVEVRDVNDVIKQYRQMQKMMDQLRKGRFPKIPGLEGIDMDSLGM